MGKTGGMVDGIMGRRQGRIDAQFQMCATQSPEGNSFLFQKDGCLVFYTNKMYAEAMREYAK